jgi:hypothetical protein
VTAGRLQLIAAARVAVVASIGSRLALSELLEDIALEHDDQYLLGWSHALRCEAWPRCVRHLEIN